MEWINVVWINRTLLEKEGPLSDYSWGATGMFASQFAYWQKSIQRGVEIHIFQQSWNMRTFLLQEGLEL